MLKNLFLLTCFLSFMAVCVSYSQENAASLSPEKKADIKKLLTIQGSQDIQKEVVNDIIKSFQQQLINVPEKFWNDFRKESADDELVNMLIEVYDKFYTGDEVKELIKFYETPLGKKFLVTAPQVYEESYKVGEKWGTKIATELQEKLKKEGFMNSEEEKNEPGTKK